MEKRIYTQAREEKRNIVKKVRDRALPKPYLATAFTSFHSGIVFSAGSNIGTSPTVFSEYLAHVIPEAY